MKFNEKKEEEAKNSLLHVPINQRETKDIHIHRDIKNYNNKNNIFVDKHYTYK